MARPWRPQWGTRTYVMGVVNVTPDSFSGDGLLGDLDAIRQRGQQLAFEGADLVDVGGESTRPTHEPVPLDEELRRAIPAITVLSDTCPLPLSIDTTKAEVARIAVEAGASVVNDISGLRDPAMLRVVADTQCHLVLVHNGPGSAVGNITEAVLSDLTELINQAVRAGVPTSALMVDPGLGFGKTWQQNLELIARLGRLQTLGLPILVGPSRKATISRVLGVSVHDRLEGTAALVAVSIARGANMVRVHDCLAMYRVARTLDAVTRPI